MWRLCYVALRYVATSQKVLIRRRQTFILLTLNMCIKYVKFDPDLEAAEDIGNVHKKVLDWKSNKKTKIVPPVFRWYYCKFLWVLILPLFPNFEGKWNISNSSHTAKTLYQKFEKNISRNETARTRFQFHHTCFSERFPWSVCLFCCRKRVGRIVRYMNVEII